MPKEFEIRSNERAESTKLTSSTFGEIVRRVAAGTMHGDTIFAREEGIFTKARSNGLDPETPVGRKYRSTHVIKQEGVQVDFVARSFSEASGLLDEKNRKLGNVYLSLKKEEPDYSRAIVQLSLDNDARISYIIAGGGPLDPKIIDEMEAWGFDPKDYQDSGNDWPKGELDERKGVRFAQKLREHFSEER